ncbi:MAG: hypothetical protein KGI04_01875 [Candidatus Micrarchaeota archaeon]|nr:hypothetical protein [Candidatus Micrarchaeota archaeon]
MVNKKKKHPKFVVPNYGAKHRKGVPARWRAQRGIDNKKRIEKQGYGASPKIGYKNAAELRFARKDGSMETLVHNEAELLEVQPNSASVAVFAHGLSRKTRAYLQKVADGKGIRIINRLRK